MPFRWKVLFPNSSFSKWSKESQGGERGEGKDILYFLLAK
jgi:hypothetical protein